MIKDKNNKSILMRPLEKLIKMPSPYSLVEGIGILHREKNKPTFKHKGIVNYLPKQAQINPNISEKYKLGIIGDILDTQGLPAIVDPSIKEFFQDCDYLIGNFESTITDLQGHKTSVKLKPEILDTLEELFPPEKTFLSVANNHAGDYSKDVFNKSVGMIEDRGFNICGWNERPYLDINDDLRLIVGTDWSNASCDWVYMINKELTPKLVCDTKFNLFYPHWGYELEIYPRPKMVKRSHGWISNFDAILAHHGHTPRAITKYDDNSEGSVSKLIVYSLGDFICGFPEKWYNYGAIMKMGIGQNSQNKWAASTINWEFVLTKPYPDQGVISSISADFPYLCED